MMLLFRLQSKSTTNTQLTEQWQNSALHSTVIFYAGFRSESVCPYKNVLWYSCGIANYHKNYHKILKNGLEYHTISWGK